MTIGNLVNQVIGSFNPS